MLICNYVTKENLRYVSFPRLRHDKVINIEMRELRYLILHISLDSSKNGSENLCSARNTTSSCSSDVDDIKEYFKAYYALFIVGQILLGIGAVPMFTIGLSYIDENCKQKLTSFYIGKINIIVWWINIFTIWKNNEY